jgi:hypothetical protein
MKIELKLNADNTWSVVCGGEVVSTHATIKAANDAKFDIQRGISAGDRFPAGWHRDHQADSAGRLRPKQKDSAVAHDCGRVSTKGRVVPVANATVAQSISRVTIAVALQAARTEAAEHQAWINAINRAALNLEACGWAFDGDVLQIASATTPAVRYTVDHRGCQCKAGQAGRPCWHRAAWRLLRKAAEMAALAEEMRAAEGLALDDAMQVAARELNAFHSYAQRWNATVLATSTRRG